MVDNFEWAVGYTMRFGLYQWEADGTVDRVLREGSKVLVRLYKSLPDNLEVGLILGLIGTDSCGSFFLETPYLTTGILFQKLKALAIKHRRNHWEDLSSPSTV